MKLSVLLLFILLLQFSPSQAQENKENILRNFNYIEYYPDSTIRLAMNFEGFKPFGYCIEFDSLGNPISIGEYRSWKRIGIWWNSDGSMTNYHDDFEIVRGFPGCGTGILQNVQRFRELYQELITKTN